MTSLIKKARENIETSRRAAEAKAAFARRQDVQDAIRRINGALGRAEASIDFNAYGARISVSVTELQTFKSGRLPRLLSRLMDAGVEFTRTADWPTSGNRDYHGHIQLADGSRIDVVVCAYLSSAASSCQVKVVGEIVTTTPKYEIVCN